MKKLHHKTITAVSIDGTEYEADKNGVFSFKKDEHADIAVALYGMTAPEKAQGNGKADGGADGGIGDGDDGK